MGDADRETTNPKVRILLIGLGYWARSEAHLPGVLRALKCQHSVTLRACVDIESAKAEIMAKLPKSVFQQILDTQKDGRAYKGIEWLPDAGGTANTGISDAHRKRLDDLVRDLEINAVIISTRVHQHYLDWALQCRDAAGQKLNVLVDKPFTTRVNLTTNAAAARKLLRDINTLMINQKSDNRVYMLGCQKRYQPPYVGLLRLIGEVHRITRYPITHIYAETADGLWWLPGERPQLRNDYVSSAGYTPGKLNDSGYHMLDIATWLLRHTWTESLHATVTTRLFTGSSSGALVARLRKMNPDNTVVRYVASEMSPARIKAEVVTDIAESIQVDFDDGEGNVVSQFQFRFEHEFASNRKLPIGAHKRFNPLPLPKLTRAGQKRRDRELVRQRNKRECLLIKHGPFAYYELRRIAKMGALPEEAFGGRNHLEVRYFINPDVASEIGCSSVGMVDATIQAKQSVRATVQSEDQYPTLEFIEAVEHGRSGGDLISTVADHEWAVRLYAAAYESGAQQGVPVRTGELRHNTAAPSVDRTLGMVTRLDRAFVGG